MELLIPALPAISALFLGIGNLTLRSSTKRLRKFSVFLTMSSIITSCFLACFTLFKQWNGQNPYRFLIEWVMTPTFKLEIGYWIDPLTAFMLVVITTVAAIVMLYTIAYMKYDEGFIRFFSYLSLFTSSMLGLVMSPNLVQLYAFWELVGMCSYLLIGFWHTRPAAAAACQKAFITNRIGDFGFLLGILGFYWFTGSFDVYEIQNKTNLIQNNWGILLSTLIFLGPMAKSAQFPLHVWLPDAMEGPTPISALIHAATMVAAGVFLIGRMFPVFQQFPFVMSEIASVGMITAIVGATIALTQDDLKKGLAYSTMSQLGYMVLGMGVGAYSSSLFHLVTHAYSKALLFLSAGSVIHGMEEVVGFNPMLNQNMQYMGGLKKEMPITRWSFLIGTLSLCGFPPFSCFWSKDEILAETFKVTPIFWLFAWLTAGLTSLYMFRMYLLTFEDDLRIQTNKKPHESPLLMQIALILLIIPTISIGFLGNPKFEWFQHFISLSHNDSVFNSIEFLKNATLSVGIAVFGLFCSLQKINILNPPFQRLFINKWFIDKIYDFYIVKNIRYFSEKLLKFDQIIVDGTINQSANMSWILAEILRNFQNGLFQSYIMTFLFSTILFVLVFFIRLTYY